MKRDKNTDDDFENNKDNMDYDDHYDVQIGSRKRYRKKKQKQKNKKKGRGYV